MSRPYQYPGDNTPTSPLDRQNQAPKPPPSFKTNVNRMKTKKWVEAPSYSYEGDDWGEYDGEDEYGVGSPSSAQASAAPTGIGPQGQGLTGGAARSFTNPEVPPLPGPRRAPSFDTGDERRAFSSGVPPGQQQAPPLQVQTNVPAESTGSRQASAASYAPSNVSDLSSLDPRHRSNYSPSAEPPPLQTHHPQPQAQYPPHRTSQNQQRSPMSSAPPSAGGIPPRESTPTSASKPLPFVRPADIYKRMEEEREKERRSMDSQRSTPDIAPRRTSEDSSSSGAGQVPRERTSMDSISRGSGRRTPLDTVAETTEQERIPRQTLPAVAERKSEYGMPESPPRVAGPATTQVPQNVALRQPRYPGPPQLSSLPQLPQFGGDTSFGDEFWESTPLGDSRGPAAPAAPQPLTSTTAQADGGLQHTPSLGFRSMVNQAFDQPARASTGMSHADSQRSLGDSSVSRSDSAATSDISPIMSRVPSSAAGTVKAQEAQRREESTPTIAEEPAEVAAPEPQRHSNATISDVHQIPRKPSPSHSRNSSVENVKSGYRRDLNTPSPSNSPARSPAVEANKQLPDPEVAELAMNSPVEETGAQIIPDNLNAATREAEVAPAANTSEMESRSANAGSGQNALEGILESSNKGLPEAPMEVELRPESPSKGKVRDLAEKFDAESRKNSPAGTPRSSSPVKPHNVVETALPTAETSTLHPSGPSTLGRPAAERELSFRPQLPGQWQSFATTATEQSEDETAKDVTPVAENERTETTPTAPQHEIERTETEKTPTSPAAPIQSLADESSTSPTDHPIAALAAAGAAMGEAIKKSVGLGETETESPKSGIRAVGDVYSNRPMAPDRMESEISTIPPASPEKENPEDIEEEEEDIPPPVPLKERSMSPEYAPKSSLTQVRPAIMTNMSTDDEPSDLESDRLRKEIVRTLSPIEPSTSVDSAQQNLTVDAGDQHAAINRDSSILPSIYDSYLGSEKEVAPVEHSHATLPEVSEASEAHESFPTGEAPHFEGPSAPNTASAVELEPTAEPSTSQPPLMKRFSWEMDDSKPDTPVSPTYPEVVAPAGAAVESQAGVSQPGHETPDNPRFSGEGLHVINAEPGEIPHIDTSTTAFQQIENSPQTVQHVSPVVVTPKGPGMATSVGIDPKFPSFREIMAVKSPDQRIVGFNSTREQWAGHDSGLGNWLASTLAAHPEHANAASFNRPIATPPSGARHKPTSSISRAFTKQFSPISSTQSQQQSVGGTSQEATPISGQRTSGTKGKDLLEKAGVLGGKGMTGAKGLFAKGRSKFRGSMGGSEKAATPSPPRAQQAPQLPSLDLENSSSGTSLQKRHSDASNKRSSRSFSPFRRSRPSSIVVPNSANEIPDIPTEPLPGAKSRRSSRSFSPFRRSRPSSIVVPDSTNFIPNIPAEPLARAARRQSYPAVSTQAPWEYQDPPESGTTTPSRLGVLPSPARDAFSRGKEVASTPEEEVIQSIVRHASPISAEKVSTALLSPANVDSSTGEAKGHQRVVSLIGPEDVQPTIRPDEPVSPVSPVEDSGMGDKDIESPEQSKIETPTTPKASQQQESVPQLDAERGRDQELPSPVSDDRDHFGTSVAAETLEADILNATPVASAKAATVSDGQKIINETSSNVKTEAERMQATADHGGIALSERPTENGAKQEKGDDDHVSLEYEDQIEEEQPDQELGASDGARQMEVKREAQTSPSDELYERPPTPQKPVMTVTTADGEKGEQDEEDDDDTPTNNNALGPSQSTAARSMPSVSSVSKSDKDEDGKGMLGPSNSTAARSMPSVSSMGHEDRVSSAGDENVDPSRPAVSPIPPSFMDREYKPPDSNRERPMSFIPLPRDPTGRPPQEEISVRSPNAGKPEEQRWELSPPQGPGSDERTPEVGSKPSPLQEITQRTPEHSPAERKSYGDQWGQRKVAEEQREDEGGYFRGAPNLRRRSGQALHPPDFQPRAGDPRMKDQGQFPVMPPGSSIGTQDPQNWTSQGLVSAQTARNTSHQSVASQDTLTDKKKRSSGLLAAFKRPTSAGTESTFSRNTSILAQASDSPTRAQYLQDPNAPVGTIPPSISEDGKQQKLSKKDASKLQRASTTQAQDPGKKKRFSALGSIFGRSGTTGHNPKTKLEKKHQPGQTTQTAPPSAFESMQQYQLHRSSRDRDLPPLPREAYLAQVGAATAPPGGFYGPQNLNVPSASGIPTNNPGRQYGPGVVNYAQLSQQQFMEERQRQIDARNRSMSLLSGRIFGGRQHSDSSTHLSPQISAGASPMEYRSASLTAMSSVSSMSSRRESAPSVHGPGSGYPPNHGPRMGSISESHQERPWAISLPGGEQEEDSEAEAVEIMRAASARWQRPSDSDEPSLTASPSQRQATGGATMPRWREVDALELYDLQAQEFARQQAAEEQQQQQQQQTGTMSHQRSGHHHARQPTSQLLLQQREQYEYWQNLHRQKQLQEQAQRLAYTDTQARAESSEAQAQVQAQAPYQQQQQPLAPPTPEQLTREREERARHTPPAADANPAIPPLPQAPIAMHQPQPQRTMQVPYTSGPAAGASVVAEGRAVDPRLEESFRSGSRNRAVVPVAGGAKEEGDAEGEKVGDGRRGEEREREVVQEEVPNLHVVNVTPGAEEGTQPKSEPEQEEKSEEEEEETEPSEGEGEFRIRLRVEDHPQPIDEEEEELQPPPSRHSEAQESEHSDDVPKMKAVSYPGDEWTPRWDIE